VTWPGGAATGRCRGGARVGVRRGRGRDAATVTGPPVRAGHLVDRDRGPDIHAKVGKTIYSVPWRFIGQRVDARETFTVVQIFHNGQLIATHGRKQQGKQTDFGHYPPEKIAFRMRTPTWCRTRAGEIGPACTQLIASLLEVNALLRLRAAQGVLGLADKHTAGRLEAACAKAIAVGDPSYRTVKGILLAGAETDPPPPAAGDGGAAVHLHGPTQLFANVIPYPPRTSTVTDLATTSRP
jgi:hypothetical protein